MKIINNLLILVIITFLANAVSAYTYLNIYIDEKGEAEFLGETNNSLSLPEGVEIKGDKIIGMTSKLTSKQGEVWTFSYSLPGSELNIVLPKGAVIKTTTSQEIYTYNNRLSIFSKNAISVQYTINNEKSNNFLLIVVILVIIINIVLYVIYKRRKNKKEHGKKRKPIKKDKLEIIKSILSEREKLIIDKLKETGKIKQSRLRKLCDNMPKASFSRHIQELERKRLIIRYGDGKNKYIYLTR